MQHRGHFLYICRWQNRLFFSAPFIVFAVIGLWAHPANAFRTLADKMTSIQAQTRADHTIEFTAQNTISTSTIQINFSQAVSSTNTIDYRQIRFMYGPAGSEVEYPVSNQASNGIWGASVDANTKFVTLNYPTSNGVPIQAGWRGSIMIGQDPTPEFPYSTTSTLDLPTVRQVQLQQQQQQIDQREVTPEQVVIEGPPQNQQRPGEQAPAEVVVDFSRVREFIRDQLSRIRNVIQQRPSGPVTSAPPPPVVAPPQDQQVTQQQQAAQTAEQERLERERKAAAGEVPTIVLPPEKTADVNPEKETTLSLRRDDGAGLEVLLPQQTIAGQGGGARDEVPRFSSINEVYTVNVKPVTVEQAQAWSTLQAPAEKRIAPAQVYIVTAYKENDEGTTAIQQFLNPIKYVFRFTEEEIAGIDKRSLEGYSYDGATLRKEPSLIDLETNSVTVTSDHMTVFVLAGNKINAAPITFAVKSLVSLIPVTADIALTSFGLEQAERGEQLYQGERDFSTTPGARIGFCIPGSTFEKPIKSLSLTLADQSTRFAYDATKKCYSTQLVTPQTTGTKQMALKVVYLDDQVQVLRYRASVLPALQVRLISAVAPQIIVVRKAVENANKEIKKTVETSQPALQTTAIAAGPVAAALNPGLISSSVNWYHYLNHFISALLSALGLRKRRRPWGVVYDAITKNPIDLAIVRLFTVSDQKLIETQVTDKNGRFSFLVKPGTYTIAVAKQEYVYPSVIVKGALDGDYAHVYRQEQFSIQRDEDVIEVSVPLDPPHPDVVKKTHVGLKGFLHFFSKYSMVSLFLSVGVSIALAVYVPTTLNMVLLLLNSLFMLGKIFVVTRKDKPWGTVFDALSFEAIPLAAIGIIDGKQGKLLRTRLSDYEGRFNFLVPQGEYVFTVSKDQYHFPPAHPMHTRKFKHLYLGGKVSVKRNKGYVKLDIPLEKTEPAAPAVPQRPVVQQQKKEPGKTV